MNNKAIDARLAKLEMKHKAPVTVHCVAVGAGPALRPDGSECTVNHDLMVTLGGESWLRFVVGEDRDKTN